MIEYAGNTLRTVSCIEIIRRVDDALFVHRNGGLPEGGWVERHPPYATGATPAEQVRSPIAGRVKFADWALSLDNPDEEHSLHCRANHYAGCNRRVAENQTRRIKTPGRPRP